MLESIFFSGLAGALCVLAGIYLGKRHAYSSTTPMVVEEFKLEEIEQEGFRKLLLKFEDSNHRIHRFEFHPTYAHMLSDELVKFAARALSPK